MHDLCERNTIGYRVLFPMGAFPLFLLFFPRLVNLKFKENNSVTAHFNEDGARKRASVAIVAHFVT